MSNTEPGIAPPAIDKDGNYTPAEAALWLRCDRQVVYSLIGAGHLAAKRLTPNPKSRKYLITGAALLDYRNNHLPDA